MGIPFRPPSSLTYSAPSWLLEHEGYTDIVVMTDEVGVDELYQPTTDNLVRSLPQVRPGSTYPDDTFLQNREMRRFTRGAIAGDRLVFYCMNLPSWHSPPTLTLPPDNQMPVIQTSYSARRAAKKTEWTKVTIHQSSHLFTYIERSILPALVTVSGKKIRDNVRHLSITAWKC